MHVVLRVMLVQRLLCDEIVVIHNHCLGPLARPDYSQTFFAVQYGWTFCREHSIVGNYGNDQILTKDCMSLPDSINMASMDKIKAAVK